PGAAAYEVKTPVVSRLPTYIETYSLGEASIQVKPRLPWMSSATDGLCIKAPGPGSMTPCRNSTVDPPDTSTWYQYPLGRLYPSAADPEAIAVTRCPLRYRTSAVVVLGNIVQFPPGWRAWAGGAKVVTGRFVTVMVGVALK